MSGRVSKSSRAGLQFPVARIHRKLKEGNYAERISVGAAVYLAGVTEYLVSEILELAGDVAMYDGKKRIQPHHIGKAIRRDEEINALLADVCIHEGGFKQHIEEFLLPKTKPAAVAGGSHQAPAVGANPPVTAGIQGRTVILVPATPPPPAKNAPATGTKAPSAATGKTNVASAVKSKATGPAPKKNAPAPGPKVLRAVRAPRKAY